MKLREIMTREVEVVRPQAGLQEAATKMKDLDVGSLPVCDEERLVGMVTDRDLTVRGLAEGLDLTTALVDDVMTREVVWCYDDEDIEAAAQLMADKQIRRLPVISRDKRLVGIVSLGDLAVRADDEEAQAGETLEEISWPSKPERPA